MIKFLNHIALPDFMSFETANKTFQQKFDHSASSLPYVIKSGIKVKLNCLFVPAVCQLYNIQTTPVKVLCCLLLQIIFKMSGTLSLSC